MLHNARWEISYQARISLKTHSPFSLFSSYIFRRIHIVYIRVCIYIVNRNINLRLSIANRTFLTTSLIATIVCAYIIICSMYPLTQGNCAGEGYVIHVEKSQWMTHNDHYRWKNAHTSNDPLFLRRDSQYASSVRIVKFSLYLEDKGRVFRAGEGDETTSDRLLRYWCTRVIYDITWVTSGRWDQVSFSFVSRGWTNRNDRVFLLTILKTMLVVRGTRAPHQIVLALHLGKRRKTSKKHLVFRRR